MKAVFLFEELLKNPRLLPSLNTLEEPWPQASQDFKSLFIDWLEFMLCWVLSCRDPASKVAPFSAGAFQTLGVGLGCGLNIIFCCVLMAGMGSKINTNTISKYMRKSLPFNHFFIKYQKEFQSALD